MNIVSSILQMASPMIIDKVASALGINSSLARMALTYAVPAILGAFVTKSATPSGAADLFKAVSGSDINIAGSMEKALGGAGKDQLIQSGTNSLSGLLGSGVVSSLTGALAKNGGLGSGAAASLLPLASQLVMGGLAKNIGGMDASGFAKMLAGQKDNIAAAMPTSVTAPAVPVAAPVSGAGLTKWLIPAALAAAALWYFLGNQATVQPPATTPAASVVIEGVDVGQQVTTALGTLTTTVGGIKDVATAQAALPKLQEVATSVDSVSAMASKFSADQKGLVAGLINAALPAIKTAATTALAQQGVGDIAKPVLDGIISKLEAMTK